VSSALESQSVEDIEKRLAGIKKAEKAAAEGARYGEAQQLQQEHAQGIQELNEYMEFKRGFLDPLRACCSTMGQEFVKLELDTFPCITTGFVDVSQTSACIFFKSV